MDDKKLIDRIYSGNEVSFDDIVRLLKLEGNDSSYLFQKADELTKEIFDNEMHLRAIIEFSSFCKCQCLYCGLNAHNKSIPRYRMEPDEIIENASEACKAGYRTIVLQSGEDPWYDADKISYIIKKIKAAHDVAITLSIGERSYEEYKKWREDGADRYLMKHETADEKIYNRLHPHSSFENRIKCLRWLKDLGYQTGSGFMIGLPGQSEETIARDILLLKELEVEMAGIGPFIPHPKTPLGKHDSGDLHMVLKAVALTRLIIRNINLPCTTAFTVASGNDAHIPNPFTCGANVLMKKVEPHKYREFYEIYPKKLDEPNSIYEERLSAENKITGLGLTVSKSRGDIVN